MQDGRRFRREAIRRFLAGLRPTPSGCWAWTRARSAAGYGVLRFDGRLVYAHPLAYVIFRGPIPAGLELDHLYRVRHCANPAHLEAVSHQENVRRGLAGRNNLAKTHCPSGHPYTPANTVVYRSLTRRFRRCRTCRRAQQASARRHAA
jgi:HNH endonuclease